MTFEQSIENKQAFIFELDEVLYPEKDYLLQVYYLFAQFIEYGEQIKGTDIVKFMQEDYLAAGADGIFERTAAQFNIPLKYQLNFDLLLQNARLPLKLLLFNPVLSFLKEIVAKEKQIFLFVDGDPVMQLNKIRQVEWNGLESHLIVYFAQETAAKPAPEGMILLMEKHQLSPENIVIIGKHETDQKFAENSQIDFLQVDKLLLP